jgi:hypothetical protein
MSVPGVHAPRRAGRTRQIGDRGNFVLEHRINIVMEDIQLFFSLSMWTFVISRGADIVLAFPNDLLRLVWRECWRRTFPADCSTRGCRTHPDRLTVTAELTL